jgi:quercetin dioxygenase-like cupin family protein
MTMMKYFVLLLLTIPVFAQPVKQADHTDWQVSPDGMVRAKTMHRDKNASMGLLRFTEGAQVPSHRHPDSTEQLTILSGTGVLTIEGKEYRVEAGSVISIPQGAEHSFTALSPGEAVQVYAPPGPEERFGKWETETFHP